MTSLLKIESLSKNFDGISALDNFFCDINKNEIVGLIGPNGAGKTTLFNLLTGFLEPDAGKAIFNNKLISGKPPHKIVGYGITRTFQDLRLVKQMTVIDNLLLSFQNQPGENIINVFAANKRSLEVEKSNEEKALELLNYAGIKDKANDLAGNLSYGQQKLLSIVCCLASDSQLLLLDEPIAGINPEMRTKILSIIKELPPKGKSVILIEHDMDFIMEICDRVIFMDAGKKVSEGTPEEVRNDPQVIEAYLE
ncbi:MAG: ABC transporter ATP-binding protein [Ignavibacteria bacterium]|jgi:ABC-type branched-subunit amino acid transport system ATPase component